MSILITGGGRGIGRAVALDLAKTGGSELLLVSKSASCEAVAKECNAIRPGSARAFQWDVSDTAPGAGKDVLDALQMSKGPIGLVCAAGVLGPTGPFEENDMLAWWKAMETNVGGVVRLVHAVLPRMLKDGAGRIVLFAGGGAAYGYPKFTSYGTAKAALVRFTESLAMEIGDRGPIVAIIAPGANETEMLAEVRKAGGIVKTTVSIEEPCRLVRRLLTEDVRGLHGRFIHVRDEWTETSAKALPEAHWKLRRVES
jgi:NAD(P)-dependent dehydrogenase (short-subunit alcohol dehydrogenase family)